MPSLPGTLRYSFAALLVAAAVWIPPASSTVRVRTIPAALLTAPVPDESLFAYVPDLIDVVFSDSARIRLRSGVLVDLNGSGALSGVNAILDTLPGYTWFAFSEASEPDLDALRAQAEANGGGPVPDLNNIYRLQIPPGYDPWGISGPLSNLPGIVYAEPVPLAPDPPDDPLAPKDLVADQKYLNPAPFGIDALFAWTLKGGKGDGVTLCDVEQGWQFNHPDLSQSKAAAQISPNPAYGQIPHGTQVLGEIVSDDDGKGTTGVCPKATLMLASDKYKASGQDAAQFNPAGAIALAATKLSAGDVMLLEEQWNYGSSTGRMIPIEWYGTNQLGGRDRKDALKSQQKDPVYNAIVAAVKKGIHVVEAGGNGGENTDELESGAKWLDPASGATIVGAGGAGDRVKIGFSSFGSHFSLQGWGKDVVTTGVGNYKNYPGGYSYTNNFGGTSAASPMVAGAMASCIGVWRAAGLKAADLTPDVLRKLLIDTGTGQKDDPDSQKHIGPQPDLKDALSKLTAMIKEKEGKKENNACSDGHLRSPGVASYDVFATCSLDTVPNTYVLRVSDSRGWIVGGPMEVDQALSPGQCSITLVTQILPGGCQPGDLDSLTFVAFPVQDPSAADTCITVDTCESITPVAVAALAAVPGHGYVDISWSSHFGATPATFQVLRRVHGQAAFEQVGGDVHGGDGTHTYRDASVEPAAGYEYEIAGRTDGAWNYSGAMEVETPALEFALRGITPNPSGGSARIDYELPQPGVASVDVFDVAGRHVVTLFAGLAPAGTGSLTWNGRGGPAMSRAAGMYFVRLRAGGRTATRKLVMTR